MPIYEYRCEACGHEQEFLQKISDPLLTDCPACSQPSLKKKVSAAGFRLKGSGWYETDFKSGNKKNVAGSDSSPSSSAAKSGGGSDSASPAKTESKKSDTKAASTTSSSSSSSST